MAKKANPGLDALNHTLSALTNLKVSLSLVRDHLSKLQRRSEGYDLLFDDNGEFAGMRYRRDPTEVIEANSYLCLEIKSDCEWLPKYIDSLWESRAEVDNAIAALPSILTDKLDALTRSPWIASARRHCLDKILAWPGETAHQTSMAAEKVYGSIPELLELAEKREPYSIWTQYLELLEGYSHDVFAIRDAVLPKVEWTGEGKHSTASKDEPDRATLGKKQLAALEEIEKNGPILGKVLAKRLEVELSTLRTHIIPAIRPFGVKSSRDGYYIARR